MTLDDYKFDQEKLKKLLYKPPCYLTSEEKWYLLGTLLEHFGINFDKKKNVLYLSWGIEDNSHFKELQKILNSLCGILTLGIYLKKDGIWEIKL